MPTRTVKPFTERYRRMQGASVELLSTGFDRRVYRVTAPGGRDGHDIEVFGDKPAFIVGDCDCDAFRFLRDPEGCVHTFKLKEHINGDNMTNELATRSNGMIAAPTAELPSFEVMESVLGTGDIGKLSPRQKVEYYLSLCESLHLNPMSRPFEFIAFQGKVIPYAKKDAADQLRKLHGVSITKLERDFDDGMYTVVVTAQLPDGRQDQSTGVVSLGNLQGDARANALMRCETKAKRRVTLSIVGLGFLDESELDTMQGAQRIRFNPADGDMDFQSSPIQPEGNSVSAEFADTKKRILDKGKTLDSDVWKTYFKANIGKWADRTLADLRRIEESVDIMVAGAKALPVDDTLDDPFANDDDGVASEDGNE